MVIKFIEICSHSWHIHMYDVITKTLANTRPLDHFIFIHYLVPVKSRRYIN